MKINANILSGAAALVFVGAMFVPTAAFADCSTNPALCSGKVPSSGFTVPMGSGSSNPKPNTVYNNPKPVYSSGKTPTYNSCFNCGGAIAASRSSYLSLNFDFTHNENNQHTTQNTTNNVNVNGNNNNVGINNSSESNQNAGISTGYSYGGADAYYDYFSSFRRSNSSTNGNNTTSSTGSTLHNSTNQSNNFNSNTNNDDDDDDGDNDHDENVSCELDASDTTVDEGDRVTLEWETDNADHASINQGIGTVDEDGGTERVTIDDDTTFRMTVRNNDGDEDTCSVTVRVDDDNNNDFSGIVIDEGPTQNPYSNVYLSDIPYTGLDLGPYAWAYWAAFAGLIAAGGYVIFFMGIPFVLRRVTAVADEVENEIAEEENINVQKSVMTMPVAATSNGTAKIVAQSDITDFVNALVDADNEIASDILENATKNGASASVFLNRASAVLRSGAIAADASVIEMLVSSLETAAKARA